MKKKISYLTIDDAPSGNFIEIIDYLSDMEVPAIFFCEGRKLEKRADKAVNAIKRGFVIGNHSFDHPNFSEISIEEAKYQILRTDRIIEDIYKQSGVTRPMKVFRFPYFNNGSKDKYLTCDWQNEHIRAIQNILQELGYKQPQFDNINYGWFKKAGFDKCLNVDRTYDSFDWCLKDGEEIFGYHDLPSVLSRIDEDVPEGGRGLNYNYSNEIILMHNWISIEAFSAIIEKLLTKDIVFTIPELEVK